MLKRRGPSTACYVTKVSTVLIYAGNENWFQSHDLVNIFVKW